MNYKKLTKNELITLLELHDNPVQVKDPKSVYDYLKPYGKEPQEHFIVLMVDTAFNVKNVKVVTIGIANRCLVHPREVFAPAIEARCTAIFIAHNHPSGNLTPSEEDIELSDRLANAGRILGIWLPAEPRVLLQALIESCQVFHVWSAGLPRICKS